MAGSNSVSTVIAIQRSLRCLPPKIRLAHRISDRISDNGRKLNFQSLSHFPSVLGPIATPKPTLYLFSLQSLSDRRLQQGSHGMSREFSVCLWNELIPLNTAHQRERSFLQQRQWSHHDSPKQFCSCSCQSLHFTIIPLAPEEVKSQGNQ